AREPLASVCGSFPGNSPVPGTICCTTTFSPSVGGNASGVQFYERAESEPRPAATAGRSTEARSAAGRSEPARTAEAGQPEPEARPATAGRPGPAEPEQVVRQLASTANPMPSPA